MKKTADDICLEIYLGEMVDIDPYDEPIINNRLTELVQTAKEVNSGIWARGFIRNQALKNNGFDPEIIMTIAAHEYMKEVDYNGC